MKIPMQVQNSVTFGKQEKKKTFGYLENILNLHADS